MIMELVKNCSFTVTTTDSKQSRLCRLKNGVLQESVLALLLFNIYTYNLPSTAPTTSHLNVLVQSPSLHWGGLKWLVNSPRISSSGNSPLNNSSRFLSLLSYAWSHGVPFPALGRVKMACQFPKSLILGRFSFEQLFSFFIPAVLCAITYGQHS